MIFVSELPTLDPRRAAIRDALAADETATVEALLPQAAISADANARVADQARKLVIAVREKRNTLGGLDAFMHEYDLASDEGVMLMCLAEALLRIPDADTADRLIRDKLVQGKWDEHLGHSKSLFVNASTWSLMLTGHIVRSDRLSIDDIGAFLTRLTARLGEPVIRVVMNRAMRIMARLEPGGP